VWHAHVLHRRAAGAPVDAPPRVALSFTPKDLTDL